MSLWFAEMYNVKVVFGLWSEHDLKKGQMSLDISVSIFIHGIHHQLGRCGLGNGFSRGGYWLLHRPDVASLNFQPLKDLPATRSQCLFNCSHRPPSPPHPQCTHTHTHPSNPLSPNDERLHHVKRALSNKQAYLFSPLPLPVNNELWVSLLITIIVNVKRGSVASCPSPLLISFFYIKMLCAFVSAVGNPPSPPPKGEAN